MKRKETLESFNFLAWHSYDPGLWLTRSDDERFRDLSDVIAYAKKKPLIVSVGSHGGDDHVGIAFAMKAVPAFKNTKMIFSDTGDNGKIQYLLGKNVDMVAGNVATISGVSWIARCVRSPCCMTNRGFYCRMSRLSRR